MTREATSRLAAPTQRSPRVGTITGRALLVGALTVAVLSVATPYFGAVTRTWDPGGSALPATAVVVLFALVLCNGALVRLTPRLALTRVELLVTYAMVIMVVQFLYKGGLPFITGATTFPFYMATPANDWEHRMWPHLPLWFRVADPQAVTWYWEGAPPGVGVPWAAWIRPVLAWSSFTVALMTAMFCLAALLSKDWIERQRLSFPLVEIPLAITGDAAQPTLGGSVLKNRITWLGFSVPAVLSLLGWLHRIYPSVPTVPLEFDFGRALAGSGLPWSVLSGESGVHGTVLFPLIGIAYLLPGEVSLSLWLFYLLYRVQQLTWASFGIAPGGSSAVGINPQTFIGMEEAGGFLALSVIVCYQSRHSLLAAWRGVFDRASRERDDRAPLSGQAALLGFALANGFMLWWALQVGMTWWPFALVMGLFYTVMIGVTRLVAAAGTTHVDTGLFPRQVILNTVGAAAVGVPSLTAYTYLSTAYMYDPRIVLMAQAMNGFKLLHSSHIGGRRFPTAATLAVIVMLAVGFPTMLWIIYRYGATTLPDWPLASPGRWVFGELDSSLRSPEAPDNWLRLALVLGAGCMAGLTVMHSRFLWWPVSPVGFLIASGWSTDQFVWLNALVGWIFSTAVRHFGGLRLYRTLRPLFLGLVLGSYATQGLLSLISAIFGVRPLD